MYAPEKTQNRRHKYKPQNISCNTLFCATIDSCHWCKLWENFSICDQNAVKNKIKIADYFFTTTPGCPLQIFFFGASLLHPYTNGRLEGRRLGRALPPGAPDGDVVTVEGVVVRLEVPPPRDGGLQGIGAGGDRTGGAKPDLPLRWNSVENQTVPRKNEPESDKN